VIEHDYEPAIAETTGMALRSHLAIMIYAVLFMRTKVVALRMKQAVSIAK
jgi:hypothetical protein